jgi:hypothetical protein
MKLMMIWTDESFISSASIEYQTRISIALVKCVNISSKETLEIMKPIFMNCISTYLQTSRTSTRELGMIVAEYVITYIDPSTPLHFECESQFQWVVEDLEIEEFFSTEGEILFKSTKDAVSNDNNNNIEKNDKLNTELSNNDPFKSTKDAVSNDNNNNIEKNDKLNTLLSNNDMDEFKTFEIIKPTDKCIDQPKYIYY